MLSYLPIAIAANVKGSKNDQNHNRNQKKSRFFQNNLQDYHQTISQKILQKNYRRKIEI